MTSIVTRSSVVALKKEVNEGTPVKPTSATDYVAEQDDFTMEPSFDVLENAELKSSIGKTKSILGLENPTASISHYLRGSGTAGTKPNYGFLLEASLGAVAAAGTEYPTVSSSTVSTIKVNTGIGANFQRGQMLLIKDPVNGYRIRAIDSVSTDDLLLGFQLPTAMAPGSGVNLGKAVLYYPLNTGHPTLTVWNYLGNGGAIQMIAGARVTSITFDITAGDLINGSYDIEGTAFYFDPIEIGATDIYLDFTDDDGTFAAVITAKMYKDPDQLADALTVAMNAANPGETHTVLYSDVTGKFTIKSTGTLLSLLWNTGTNAANTVGDKLGFSVAADSTGTAATTGYSSATAQVYSAPQTPTFDSADPLAAKNNEVLIGDTADYACFNASSVQVKIATPKANKPSICAESGVSGSIITTREVTVTVKALLDQYDVDKWTRFRNGISTKFQFSYGEKSGGNWVPGKCGCIYVPTATITSWNIDDSDGLAQLNFELTGFVDNGLGEIYVNA